MRVNESNENYLECIIYGKRQQYHACSENDLEAAKKFYDNFTYIGSGHTYFVNGTKNVFEKLHHFFIKKF